MAPAQKDILVAKKITATIDQDPTDILDEYNYKWVFEPLFELGLNYKEINTLVCAIIYSYSPNSNRVDLKLDGRMINESILKGLGADLKRSIFQDFLSQENKVILEAIGNFLDTLVTWQYVSARQDMDYHAKYIRATEDEKEFALLDADKKYKARSEIGRLKKEALNHRQTAEVLLAQLRTNDMIPDERTKQDFGASFVDNSIKIDPWSWREWLQYEYLPSRKK